MSINKNIKTHGTSLSIFLRRARKFTYLRFLYRMIAKSSACFQDVQKVIEDKNML